VLPLVGLSALACEAAYAAVTIDDAGAALGIEVRAPFVLRLPHDDWPRLAIAHEYAHVFLIITDHPSHRAPAQSDAATVMAWDQGREDAVAETVRLWGFDVNNHANLMAYIRAHPQGPHEAPS
jgi:hypothetical protein